MGEEQVATHPSSSRVDGRETQHLRARVAELEAEVAQLREGLMSRQQIGLIAGVLTQQLSLTPEQAWSYLVRLSSISNVKVRDIARLLHAQYFGQLTDRDFELGARLNDHLPSRMQLRVKRSTEDL